MKNLFDQNRWLGDYNSPLDLACVNIFSLHPMLNIWTSDRAFPIIVRDSLYEGIKNYIDDEKGI